MPLLIEDVLARLGRGGGADALVWRTGTRSENGFADAVRGRAAQLRESGLHPGDRIAIHLTKGPVAVECLFACLACGAIAVPIDTATPPERLKAILSETGPRCIVTDAAFDCDLASVASVIVELDPFAEDFPETGPKFQTPNFRGDDVALILMTSGSTGPPKGIAITHANITAFSDWAIETFGLTAEDRFISIAPLHFDLSILDVLTSRRLGAPVYLAEKPETLFPGQLTRAIEVQAITILYTVPTVLQMMHRHGGLADRDLGALRWMLFAGEVYPACRLAALMTDVPGPRYANLYGPTETNVICCDFVEAPPPVDQPPSIGRPCPHSQIVICDQSGGPLYTGAKGEICVAGSTVMDGYWGRPELTRSCYFEGEERLFRTGDLGFVDACGAIRFLGRRDRQVKLRGHRIELQEIEGVALASGLVESTVATVIDEDPQRGSLCLHVAAIDPAKFDAGALRVFLAERLTAAALPDRILYHDTMPLTSTSKFDHVALQTAHRAALKAIKELG